MSERYTLDDLTRAADVTVRTVRYYIGEGLLPPPDGSGRAARYAPEHLNRLVIIAALKERHLPLKEIGEYLHQLSVDDIALAADEIRIGQHDVTDGATSKRELSDATTLDTELFLTGEGQGGEGQGGDDDATPTEATVASFSRRHRSLPPMAPPSDPSAETGLRMLREEPGEPLDILAYIRAVRDAPPLRRPTPLVPPLQRPVPPMPPDPDDAVAWRRLRIGAEADLLISDAQYRRHRRAIDRLIAEVRRVIEP